MSCNLYELNIKNTLINVFINYIHTLFQAAETLNIAVTFPTLQDLTPFINNFKFSKFP